MRKLLVVCVLRLNAMCINIFPCFPPFLQREVTSVTSCLLLWTNKPFDNGVNCLRKDFDPYGTVYFL